MLIKEYKNLFTKQLSSIYDVGEAESFFFIILDNKHQLKRIDLALDINLEFSEIEMKIWNEILEKLKQQIPLQYILGTTSFYDLEFEVNNDVLIPRPETEELVAWILSNVEITKSANKLKILDIGTGSGCIAISLAKNISNSEVFAIDVSEKALAIAKKNTSANKVKVIFIEENILNTENLHQTFDVIVSNPPYVRNLEKQEINKNVLDYEPHLALFVEDDDALLFYRKIAHLAQRNLSENGQLYFEINQYLGKQTIELLQEKGFKNIQLKKDIYGNDRMILCSI